VLLGAAFAIVFILSGIRWGEEWQRFLACFLGSVVLVGAALASVIILS
jgi:hypothetical protein